MLVAEYIAKDRLHGREQAFSEAEVLSRRHTSHLGTRSLDILYVATALVLGVPAFVTADTRQAPTGNSLGLRVTSLG